MLIKEIPAFCYYLLNYTIPKALADPRYGITHYHHPELLVALDAISPELRLHDLIMEYLFEKGAMTEWTGTASELESILNGTYLLRDISPSTACTGKYLNRLEEKKDQPHLQLLVTNKRTKKSRDYHIALKEG